MINIKTYIKEAFNGQPVNSADQKMVLYIAKDGHLKWKKMPARTGITREETEKPGLWANIHAKRNRIKAGSHERMRKPGSEGAPTKQDFKSASVKEEAEYDEWTEMTRSELKISINSAQEILKMMDDGVEVERWQISEITKASEALAAVFNNMNADKDEK